jgi:hypothetical protein
MDILSWRPDKRSGLGILRSLIAMTGLHQKEATQIERIQENVLARSERKFLNWMCARMPDRVSPDMLTTLGI